MLSLLPFGNYPEVVIFIFIIFIFFEGIFNILDTPISFFHVYEGAAKDSGVVIRQPQKHSVIKQVQ